MKSNVSLKIKHVSRNKCNLHNLLLFQILKRGAFLSHFIATLILRKLCRNIASIDRTTYMSHPYWKINIYWKYMVGITRGWSILNTLIFWGVKLVSYYIMFNFEEFLYHIIELIYMYLWVIIVIMFEFL